MNNGSGHVKQIQTLGIKTKEFNVKLLANIIYYTIKNNLMKLKNFTKIMNYRN